MACLCENQLCEFHQPAEHWQIRKSFEGEMRVEIIHNGKRRVLNRYRYTGPSGCKLLLCDSCHKLVQLAFGLNSLK